MQTKYQKLVDSTFFSSDLRDALYKDGTKDYIKDNYRFNLANKRLGYPKNKVIYEMGAYPGTGLYYFGENNNIVGVGKSTADFTEKFGLLGHNILEIDFENFLVPEQHKEKADVVLIMEVIEHIRNPFKFLKNLCGFLKHGGELYLTTNNFSYIGYILKLIFNKPILDTIITEGSFYPGHCRYYHPAELIKIFKEIELEVQLSNFVNFLPNSKLYKNEVFGWSKNVLIFASPKRYSTHFEILAKKI